MCTDQPTKWYEKLVDWVIGDDPATNQELICSKCSARNGLVPKDQIGKISTRKF